MESLSRVQLFAIPWTVAYQASSMGFSRQEYWSGLPFPSPGNLPDPGIKPRSPALQADVLLSEPPGKPPHPLPRRKKNIYIYISFKSPLHFLFTTKHWGIGSILVFFPQV